MRLWLMRGTIHLATVRDALAFKPLTQVVAERQHRGGHYGRRMGGADIEALVRRRGLLAEEPLGGRELGRRLVARGSAMTPRRSATRLARTCRSSRSLPAGSGAARSGEARDDRVVDGPRARAQALDRRLRAALPPAFGPASVADIQNWSGLTRLRRWSSGSATAWSSSGRARQRALRPSGCAAARPDVPAPVRLLGEYDNLLLGHADRTRIIPADFPWAAMLAPGRFVSNLLVDGELRATWWIEREGKRRRSWASGRSDGSPSASARRRGRGAADGRVRGGRREREGRALRRPRLGDPLVDEDVVAVDAGRRPENCCIRSPSARGISSSKTGSAATAFSSVSKKLIESDLPELRSASSMKP